MSFSSLLSQIRKDKSVNDVSSISRSIPTNKQQNQNQSSSSRNGDRTLSKSRKQAVVASELMDPAVARLKEARRKEKEKEMAAKAAKNPKKRIASTTKKSTTSSSSSSSKPRHATPKGPSGSRHNNNNHTEKSRKPQHTDPRLAMLEIRRSASPGGPKLSFKELMKQANTIDATKLALNPVKDTTKQQPKTTLLKKSGSGSGLNSNSYSSSRRSGSPISGSGSGSGSGTSGKLLSDARRKHNVGRGPTEARKLPSGPGASRRPPSGPRSDRDGDRDRDRARERERNREEPRAPPIPKGPAPFARPSSDLMKKLKSKDKPRSRMGMGPPRGPSGMRRPVSSSDPRSRAHDRDRAMGRDRERDRPRKKQPPSRAEYDDIDAGGSDSFGIDAEEEEDEDLDDG
ncbi:unnamed protein product [Ambrosiozyma monospora]|uniref:Unnamed protein product n=1 Tax=Ambrosiozyma monospora TaxID=43982 RepID=A0A9W6Z2S2_AMBMO|nr:unnamed protein product [Ambrosiozyma monospora]